MKSNVFVISGNGLFVDNIVLDELATIKEILERHPELKTVPVVNNEADPEKSWWKPKTWRADVQYPVAVARNIYNHQQQYFQSKQNLIR